MFIGCRELRTIIEARGDNPEKDRARYTTNPLEMLQYLRDPRSTYAREVLSNRNITRDVTLAAIGAVVERYTKNPNAGVVFLDRLLKNPAAEKHVSNIADLLFEKLPPNLKPIVLAHGRVSLPLASAIAKDPATKLRGVRQYNNSYESTLGAMLRNQRIRSADRRTLIPLIVNLYPSLLSSGVNEILTLGLRSFKSLDKINDQDAVVQSLWNYMTHHRREREIANLLLRYPEDVRQRNLVKYLDVLSSQTNQWNRDQIARFLDKPEVRRVVDSLDVEDVEF